jgi:hypothetical protein
VRPDLFCWIRLFPLDIRHLAERMFFTGYAKEEHAKRNADDALAKEASHNALPQLSVSGVARKDESGAAQASCLWGRRASSLPNVSGRNVAA